MTSRAWHEWIDSFAHKENLGNFFELCILYQNKKWENNDPKIVHKWFGLTSNTTWYGSIQSVVIRAFYVKAKSGKAKTLILYVSDPCEHQCKNREEDDIGIFRGVFRDFLTSATRRLFVDLHVELESKEVCPYCFNRVWNLLNANMIPKSAHRRLGAYGLVEYFVCLNGHLYGHCSLLHLSDTESGWRNAECMCTGFFTVATFCLSF